SSDDVVDLVGAGAGGHDDQHLRGVDGGHASSLGGEGRYSDSSAGSRLGTSSARRTHRGIHQFARPSNSITEGTSSARISVASISTEINGITASLACSPQIASLPCPCWKMKTTTPKAHPSETRLSTTAFSGRTIERNARISSTNVSRMTKPRTYGKLP